MWGGDLCDVIVLFVRIDYVVDDYFVDMVREYGGDGFIQSVVVGEVLVVNKVVFVKYVCYVGNVFSCECCV